MYDNETGEEIFNRDPANCNDISKLGYTLNGYYLVNVSQDVGQFGVCYCQFKLPPGADRRNSRR